jgi:LexA-binding, inner membrane-associated putative hydrolase
VLLPFHEFNGWHRVITHNVFYVLAVAAVCAAVARNEKGKQALAVIIGGLMHLGLDSMLDSNPSNGIGVAFFWPLVATPMSLVNLAPLNCPAGWSNVWQMVSCSWLVLLFELPFWIIAAIVIFHYKRSISPRPIIRRVDERERAHMMGLVPSCRLSIKQSVRSPSHRRQGQPVLHIDRFGSMIAGWQNFQWMQFSDLFAAEFLMRRGQTSMPCCHATDLFSLDQPSSDRIGVPDRRFEKRPSRG